MRRHVHWLPIVIAAWIALAGMRLVDVEAANATVNCPAQDQQLWLSSEFAIVEENLQQCGLQSLGVEADARTCLNARSQLSSSCVECQVTLISCTVHFCTSACASGGRANPTCVDCVNNNSPCNPNFRTCTNGFKFPDCPECVQPTPKSSNNDGFIPSTSLGASIGIVVGIAVVVLLFIGITTYFLCVRDNREEFVPSKHSIHDAGSSSPNLMGIAGTPAGFNGSPLQQNQLKGYAKSMDEYDGPAYAYSPPVTKEILDDV